MASRRRSSGPFGLIMSIIGLVLAAAVVFAWINMNNIRSFDDAVDFFRGKSDSVGECVDGLKWTCDTSTDDGKGDDGSTPKPPEKPSADAAAAIETLKSVPTQEEQKIDYDRGNWPHWSTVKDACDTREMILQQQGKNVKTDEKCKAVSGEWTDPYEGKQYTNASDLDIDHVIPLGYAAAHGGQEWSAEKKEQFANDQSQLLAVGASPNRSKSDKGPSEWMPPNKDFQCSYAIKWVDTASKYDLGLAKAHKDTLTATLSKCK